MSESVRSFPLYAAPAAALTRPTTREWARHGALFALTFLTATWGGLTLLLPYGEAPETTIPAPAAALDYLLYVPRLYAAALADVGSYALAHPPFIFEGLKFSASLLAILLAHEAGHYVACRRYRVDATLPFFIPVPPPFIAGTLGAFIKIKSLIPTRRALFDIGVAGPLAGFAVIIPVALAAMLTAEPYAAPFPPGGDDVAVIFFNDPALLRLLASAAGVADLPGIAPNPFYFAAWIGLLVTSLNLLPVGQLDGGHAVYALLGRRAHARVGRLAFAGMLVLAPLGWMWHGAPSGFLYAALLFVMLRVRHPEAGDERQPLGRSRAAIALLTLAVFLLSFLPFPLTVR
ncbi:MAG TPA: site-2 protease family protein [Pyrinomonadaceae bacterium]|nr:site-2 protease family protein [Pyrinomonadaceae bacterium]